MSNKELENMYDYYSKESNRLISISKRTRKRRVKSKLFNRLLKLKDKYDWTYDELYLRGIL